MRLLCIWGVRYDQALEGFFCMHSYVRRLLALDVWEWSNRHCISTAGVNKVNRWGC